MSNEIGVIIWFVLVVALIWGFGGFVAYIESQEQKKMDKSKTRIKNLRSEK